MNRFVKNRGSYSRKFKALSRFRKSLNTPKRGRRGGIKL